VGIVADDGVDFVGQEVAHGALDKVRLTEDARGRWPLLDLLLDGAPLLDQQPRSRTK